jgi:hypothetical protein
MLSSRQIIQYDPLVSDAACHTRAPYFIYLARKTKTAPLSKEELTYLEACKILTETQARQYDVFNVITDERTDINKIPSQYIETSASSNKKNIFLAQKKKEVATTTLDFLLKNTTEMVLDTAPDAFTFYIPTSRQFIPVVPLYISAKMMLHYAAKQAIPIVVNLKRLVLRESEFLLDGAVSMSYTYNSTTEKFAIQEIKEDKDEQEVIAMDMVSCYVKGTEKEVGGFLMSDTFQIFLELFKKEDLVTLVMLCAAGHSQYPASAEPSKSIKSKSTIPIPPPTTAIEEISESKVPTLTTVSLNECSQKEFQQLSDLARRYGFFRQNAQYVQLDRKSNTLQRTTTSLFYMDHVYTSTMMQCQMATAKLLEKQALLKADAVEKLPSLAIKVNAP